jgi:phospholipase D1/2
MSLWAEHLGLLEDCFSKPQTLKCVKRVNELAENNWHLLKYPVQVGRDGSVGPLPGNECFPDVGGKILGAHSSLPDALTT